MFNISQEAELLYRIVQWDEDLLHPGNIIAASPLFNIESSKDAIRQLHLPHCEPQEGEQSTAHDMTQLLIHSSDGVPYWL